MLTSTRTVIEDVVTKDARCSVQGGGSGIGIEQQRDLVGAGEPGSRFGVLPTMITKSGASHSMARLIFLMRRPDEAGASLLNPSNLPPDQCCTLLSIRRFLLYYRSQGEIEFDSSPMWMAVV